MADSNPPEQFKDMVELSEYAKTMPDIDEMIRFVEAENLKLDPPWGVEDLSGLLNKISTYIRETQPDRLYKQCLEEMKKLVPDDDEDKRPEQVKNFIKCGNLLKLNEDEALEIIIKTCKKIKLITKWESVIIKFYKRLKDEAANQNRISNVGKKDETGNDVEIELIESLAAQNGKGLLACEKWVTEFKLVIVKMQPESLAKKLIDPRERKYTHSNFICSVKDKFLLSSYETEEVYKKNTCNQ